MITKGEARLRETQSRLRALQDDVILIIATKYDFPHAKIGVTVENCFAGGDAFLISATSLHH